MAWQKILKRGITSPNVSNLGDNCCKPCHHIFCHIIFSRCQNQPKNVSTNNTIVDIFVLFAGFRHQNDVQLVIQPREPPCVEVASQRQCSEIKLINAGRQIWSLTNVTLKGLPHRTETVTRDLSHFLPSKDCKAMAVKVHSLSDKPPKSELPTPYPKYLAMSRGFANPKAIRNAQKKVRLLISSFYKLEVYIFIQTQCFQSVQLSLSCPSTHHIKGSLESPVACCGHHPRLCERGTCRPENSWCDPSCIQLKREPHSLKHRLNGAKQTPSTN